MGHNIHTIINREKLGTSIVVGRMYNPVAIINHYYKKPLIKEMYNFSEQIMKLKFALGLMEFSSAPYFNIQMSMKITKNGSKTTGACI